MDAERGKETMAWALWSRPYLLLTATATFWAGNSIVGRAARDLVPPAALSFWRWTLALALLMPLAWPYLKRDWPVLRAHWRSEEHTSELQSLMRNSYAVFFLKKKPINTIIPTT